MDKRYNTFERDQEANSFYHSKEWRKVRDYVIAKQMNTCQFCGDIVTDKKIVDHLIRREYCNNPLDTSNLNVLCQTCHNFKSNMETSMKAHGKENVLKYASFNWWKKTILKKRNKHTHP